MLFLSNDKLRTIHDSQTKAALNSIIIPIRPMTYELLDGSHTSPTMHHSMTETSYTNHGSLSQNLTAKRARPIKRIYN